MTILSTGQSSDCPTLLRSTSGGRACGGGWLRSGGQAECVLSRRGRRWDGGRGGLGRGGGRRGRGRWRNSAAGRGGRRVAYRPGGPGGASSRRCSGCDCWGSEVPRGRE